MKRILLASAMFSMCAYNAMANDCCADNGDERADLTGFLLSLGGVLDIDKYDADIDVAAKYSSVGSTRYVQVDSGFKDDDGDKKFDGDEGYDILVNNLKGTNPEMDKEVDANGALNGTYVKKGAKIVTIGSTLPSYFQRYVKAKKNKTVAGGELKGSAFYNVENGLVVGFDLGLAFTGKGKKRVDINTKFSKAASSEAKLYYTNAAAALVSATTDDDADNGLAEAKKEQLETKTSVLKVKAGGYFAYLTGNATAAKDGLNEGAHETSGVEYAAVITPGATDIDGKIGSLEFEKDPFSPTAAFLVGGYFKGFFGALRLGINYMTGKVKGLQNAEGAAMTYADGTAIKLDHKIRQISPVLGVQFMKHIKRGVFVYATYDHMFGARKSYLVNSPVKNFKRRQHRISLGLAYHIITQ